MPGMERPDSCRRARPLLGTLVEIEARGRAAAHAVEAGFAAVARVQRLMSRFDPASDISRLNAAPVGQPVRVDIATASVLALGAELASASGGQFSCAPGASTATEALPAWTMADSFIYKHAPVCFDLGGIAKGYAVDCAIETMLALMGEDGAELALVNAGGDMRHAGITPVRVALREPGEPARIARVLPLANAALASSAVGGLAPEAGAAPRITRVPDAPGTGQERGLPPDAGATVLAPTCMHADALTKVVLLCGDPEHPLLARHHACTLLYRDGTLAPARA
ncbi:FAD:protein FMN transferase [Cupriavidus taiwanensis]|uniref:FAD:protein FMN transferase n=1 Tax=Cupriavidus taiwanensis TaxID=164546 RepID=A0A7Z7JFT6_9BURK|nr:FAD:protein FMN transferase [Cupriavidus taiwanensis]SOZ17565.1 conserved hypothetical protein [Cupriavidus taiwanensis]SOZ96241.1 conserved hypothetical protein [Cupriavidus taiwanensis]SPC25792.1 conserved hypothetical protein [Cupriavidus taiwanensis]